MSARSGSGGSGRGRGSSSSGSRQNNHRATSTTRSETINRGNTNTSTQHSGRNQQHQQHRNNNHHHQHNGYSQQRSNGNNNNNQNSISHQRSPQAIPISGIPYGFLPAFLPGSASLAEQLDQRVMIVLRDGRHLVGTLRSFDQFSNMVLEETSERRILHAKVPHLSNSIIIDNNGTGNQTGGDGGKTVICYYTDVQLGLYLVRGDSMVLLGEVDDDESTETTDGEQMSQTEDNPASSAGLSGSGLLMGGKVNQRKNEMKTRMKRVSLEEFEELEKKIEEDGVQVDALTWEFDMDLAI